MSIKFDKSIERFSIKASLNFLNFCGISPLDSYAHKAVAEFSDHHLNEGYRLFFKYGNPLNSFKVSTAKLLHTEAKNISFISSAAYGLNLVANAYPFKNGDEIISYVHEYPSNHYPWKLQEQRGAKLVLLSDQKLFQELDKSQPQAWDFSELEKLVNKKTKLISLSHVQFCSGYAADLSKLSSFCDEQGIDLVIDAAQSMGCLNIDLKKFKISAVVASGWKWLLGPIGGSVLYTSPEFREKLKLTTVGLDTMRQGSDYLNHTWDPHDDGRMFECSTQSLTSVVGLQASIDNNALEYGIVEIEKEVFRLQQIILDNLDPDKYKIILFNKENRSGILSIVPVNKTSDEVSEILFKDGIATTVRGGYLRLAPHYCSTDEEVQRAVEVLNKV